MIITTTQTVDGYRIKEYIGPVAGADVYLPGGFLGEGIAASRQSAMVSMAYTNAISNMKANASSADAIVNINMEITGITTGNVVVAVTGTAVKLEKIPTAEQAAAQAAAAAEQAAKEAERQRKVEEQQKIEREAFEEQLRKQLDEQQVPSFDFSCIDATGKRALSDGLSYAIGLAGTSQARRKVKNIGVDCDAISYLLSVSDEMFKPVCQQIIDQLRKSE